MFPQFCRSLENGSEPKFTQCATELHDKSKTYVKKLRMHDADLIPKDERISHQKLATDAKEKCCEMLADNRWGPAAATQAKTDEPALPTSFKAAIADVLKESGLRPRGPGNNGQRGGGGGSSGGGGGQNPHKNNACNDCNVKGHVKRNCRKPGGGAHQPNTNGTNGNAGGSSGGQSRSNRPKDKFPGGANWWKTPPVAGKCLGDDADHASMKIGAKEWKWCSLCKEDRDGNAVPGMRKRHNKDGHAAFKQRTAARTQTSDQAGMAAQQDNDEGDFISFGSLRVD